VLQRVTADHQKDQEEFLDNAAGGMGTQKGSKKFKHPGRGGAGVSAVGGGVGNWVSYTGKDYGMGIGDKAGKGGAIDS